MTNNGNNNPKNNFDETKEMFGKLSKAQKKIVQILFRYGFKIQLIVSAISEGKNPSAYIRYYEKEKLGLREGTIIGNPLYFPCKNDELTFRGASAGNWNTYDFKVSHQLDIDEPISQNSIDTSLIVFPIPEILGNDTKDITPDGLFELANIEHFRTLINFNVEKVLSYGLVKETTYQEAYKDKPELLRLISEYSATDKEVLQVTPKGNTLIFPIKKSGDRTPPLNEGSTNPQKLIFV